MGLTPDIGFVYPKTGLTADLRFDEVPLFVSTGSMTLDGSNDRLDCDGAEWASTGAWTIACWVKCLGTRTSAHHLMSATDGSNTFDLYISGGSSGNVHLHDGNSGQNIASNGPLFDGTWHHLALTCGAGGGATATLYFDGQVQGTITVTCDDLSSASTFHIGQNTSGGSSFAGNISNFGIWESALSQASIRSLMTASSYTEVVSKSGATPKQFWVLDTDGGASVGQNGTLTNGAAITGDRCRLPNGFDLTGNRLDARAISGRSFDFDGTGDGLRGTTTFDINGSGDTTTLSCWFNADSLSGTNTTIVGNTKVNASNNFAIYRTGTNEIAAIAFYASATSVKVSTGSVLQSGKWYHVAATFDRDSTTIKLYVNGKEYSATPSLAYGGSENTFEIGYRYNSGSVLQAFSGKIAHVKMFDIAFTAAQALEQYQNPEQILPTGASASNLKRWYPLSDYDKPGANNLNGLFAQDCSGNGKHLIADNCGMSFSEHVPCPQLGLQNSSSRIYFDQTDDLVTVGNDAAINGLFGSGGSISVWLMPFSDGEGSFGRIVETGSGGFFFLCIDESGSACKIFFSQHFDGNDGTWKTSATDLTYGVWNHVVLTYDGSSTSNDPVIYVNGSSVSITEDVAPTGTINTDANDKLIGNSAAQDRTFHGIISEVAFFKNAILDADAVTVIYNGGVQGFDLLTDSGNYDNSSDLDGWWKLDNPVTIEDLSTNSNTGTVSGSPCMATVPEGTTADLSVCGTLTNKRLPFGWNGGSGANAYNDFSGNVFSLPDPKFGTGNYTIAFFYRCVSYPGDNASLLFNKSQDGSKFFDIFFNNNTTTRFTIQGAGGSGQKVDKSVTVTAAQQVGNWIQIVVRREAASTHSFVIHPVDASAVSISDVTDKTPGDIDSDSIYGLRFGGGYDETHEFGTPSYAQFAFPRIFAGAAITDEEVNALYVSGARLLRGT